MPALYNASREFEAPIPRTSPTNETSDLGIDNVSVENENLSDEQNVGRNEDEVEQEEAYVEPNDFQNTEHGDEANDNKPQLPLPNVVLNESDTLAVNDLFDDDNEEEVTEANEEIANIGLQPNETTYYENGTLKVTRTYGDDLEMTYTYGEDTLPLLPPRYGIKRNDIISKNYPFEENVSCKWKQIINHRWHSYSTIVFRKMVIEPIQSKLVIVSKR